VDFSKYVNDLKINTTHNYKAATNAAGNTTVRYITSKRVIQVGIIPLDAASMKQLQTELDKFTVTLAFLNPKTGALEENVKCIIPANGVEYYTVRADNVSFKAFALDFTEL
jgi:hypothetical protein